MDVLYVVERDTNAFESARATVDIVCAGDSLTGWNNFGPAEQWPYRTYTDFLNVLCLPLGLRVANGGIAGEISDNGPQQVRDYLHLFPNARYSMRCIQMTRERELSPKPCSKCCPRSNHVS